MKRKADDGFVLVGVIWFVALLSLVAVITESWVSRSLDSAIAMNDRITAQAGLMSATERITFLLVTQYFSERGVELLTGDALTQAMSPTTLALPTPTKGPYIALDDRPYRFGTGVVELQDVNGLYNVLNVDRYTLSHLLESYGVPYDQRGGLLDKLQDYQAKNSAVKHLEGANRDDYLSAGRAPPRNAPLLTPWEPFRVLNWDQYKSLWIGPSSLPELTTVSTQAQGININTAPEPVLLSLPGVDEKGADALISYRDNNVITSFAQINDITGSVVALDPFQFENFPASSIRLKLMFAGDPLVHFVNITLDPIGKMPYRIDYAVDIPQQAPDRALLRKADVPPLPLPKAPEPG